MTRLRPSGPTAMAAALVTVAALIAVSASPSQAVVDTPTGTDPVLGCIYNGYRDVPTTTGDIAVAPHCFTTPDRSTVPKVAPVDPTKTAAELTATQTWSPLHPDHRLARGTMATRDVSSAPRAANSAELTAAMLAAREHHLPDSLQGSLWSGVNIGGGVHAHDNIPIYTVDSSNPHQEFAWFATTDSRVTSFPKLYELTTGRLPLPSWAKPSDGGDHALATYDVATGIWRSYFHVVKDAAGTWTFAAAGHLYADRDAFALGQRNYWLGLLQGSSSVVGMSNELTQIGLEEVRRGVIDHMVSITFPDYASGSPSFPAKQGDGRWASPAPQAGQVFTFPRGFDVEAHIVANRIDPTTAAVMRAVAKYGGIVSDRNAFVMAFNFEHPYGMGANVNPWRDDPVIADRIGRMNLNAFPWRQIEWLPANYAGQLTNTVPVVTAPVDPPTRVDHLPLGPTSSPSPTSTATSATPVPTPTASPTCRKNPKACKQAVR